MSPLRRRLLAALGALTGPATAPASIPARASSPASRPATAPRAERAPEAERVRRGRALVFPRDHGAHPHTRIEWWYATGWVGRAAEPTHGFQLTFFRSRTGLADGLPGRLAPRQIVFAHAALTDLRERRHVHDQRLQRWNAAADPQGAAGAESDDAAVWIGPWRLHRGAEGWHARLASQQDPAWALELLLTATQPPLLQGDAGFSRKGPLETQASHYYSLPQLAVAGSLRTGRSEVPAQGRAWLDHEWSDEILAPAAVGWDWIGLNLFDGGAVTAFVVRQRDGAALWGGGSHRPAPGAAVRAFAPHELRWLPQRFWTSPGTGARYPVEAVVDTRIGTFTVRALLDAQELDSRRSTGTAYWEGLVEALDGRGRRVGLGYLEMTGYAGALRL